MAFKKLRKKAIHYESKPGTSTQPSWDKVHILLSIQFWSFGRPFMLSGGFSSPGRGWTVTNSTPLVYMGSKAADTRFWKLSFYYTLRMVEKWFWLRATEELAFALWPNNCMFVVLDFICIIKTRVTKQYLTLLCGVTFFFYYFLLYPILLPNELFATH